MAAKRLDPRTTRPDGGAERTGRTGGMTGGPAAATGIAPRDGPARREDAADFAPATDTPGPTGQAARDTRAAAPAAAVDGTVRMEGASDITRTADTPGPTGSTAPATAVATPAAPPLRTLALAARLEWRLALARRRTLALGAGIPLLLVLPVAFGGAPAFHAAAVFTVLFALFGTFGSAIPLVRDAENGLLQRLALTGAPPRALLLGRVLAGAAVDLIQLLPALAVVSAAAATSGHAPAADPLGRAAILATLLAATLLTTNAIGAWVAALARSIAEAALFAAVTVLFALHAAGVFRTPAPGSWAARIEPLVPFHHLHATLLEMLGAASTHTSGSATAALLGAAAVLVITTLLGARLLASLARIRGR